MYIRCINYYPYLSLHLSLSDGNWVRPISHHPFPRYKLNHPLISHMGSWQSEYTYVASKANQSTFNDIWMRRLILRDTYVLIWINRERTHDIFLPRRTSTVVVNYFLLSARKLLVRLIAAPLYAVLYSLWCDLWKYLLITFERNVSQFDYWISNSIIIAKINQLE